ncbi:MAG: hypothetical protein IPJ11_15560 [Gemmatimonadetes bacterium]|nr:hypothetical protein [Gemmatimonadota bacterium]
MPWIDAALGTIASVALALFFVVNATFIIALWRTRDRRFVDRWTKPLVMTDAALIFAAVGTPVIGIAMKLGGQFLGFLATIPATLIPGK